MPWLSLLASNPLRTRLDQEVPQTVRLPSILQVSFEEGPLIVVITTAVFGGVVAPTTSSIAVAATPLSREGGQADRARPRLVLPTPYRCRGGVTEPLRPVILGKRVDILLSGTSKKRVCVFCVAAVSLCLSYVCVRVQCVNVTDFVHLCASARSRHIYRDQRIILLLHGRRVLVASITRVRGDGSRRLRTTIFQ